MISPYCLVRKPVRYAVVGTVHVFLTDSIFEASCSTRHTTELGRLLKEKYSDAVAVIMYTDGGPDHNYKHTSVRLGLLALFWELCLGHHGGDAHGANSELGKPRGKDYVSA